MYFESVCSANVRCDFVRQVKVNASHSLFDDYFCNKLPKATQQIVTNNVFFFFGFQCGNKPTKKNAYSRCNFNHIQCVASLFVFVFGLTIGETVFGGCVKNSEIQMQNNIASIFVSLLSQNSNYLLIFFLLCYLRFVQKQTKEIVEYLRTLYKK